MKYTTIKKTTLAVTAILGGVFVISSCGTVPDETEAALVSAKDFSVQDAFHMVAKENDIARTLYTKGIVGPGKKAGLKFDEDWEKDDVLAGPLPALFLRGISAYIKTTDVPLGLYLGSDFPIRKSNKFTGKQADLFADMRKDSAAKFFFDEENKLNTSMFPDFAGAGPCVSCHNGHPETSKDDWVLGDIMGATTWTYPDDSLSYSEVVAILKVYREGAVATYNTYLEKTKTFEEVPELTGKWPAEGYYLPTAEEFIDSVGKLASASTLKALM